MGLTYVRLGDLPELLLGTYFDGSWATRPDGASQGGYLQFAVTRSAAESGAPVPLVVTDWASKKVSRISRASLDVEAQAGVVAVDALEFSKLFYVGMFVPSVSMQDDGVLREIGMSLVVTDAKALFYAARNMSATQGLSAANKRTAIDVTIVCERMSRFNGQWYWTNTLQQVSDGLTKVQARQRLVDNFRRGYHALKFDPTLTAGKILTIEQRQQRENELHQAAEFKTNISCCDEVMLTSEASGSVSLRGMLMCDAGYSGRTVKIVKELREKFALARSDHISTVAHPVCCMDPLRLTVHKIYAQHVPTKLPRVDKILSRHEGDGQLLLCALICKYNLSLMSVLSVLEGNSSGVPIGTGPRLFSPLSLSLSLAVVPKGTTRQKNAVEATHKGTTRERTEENLHDAESCGSVTNWWYLEARRCRRCWLITDPPHWGNECGTEPRKKRRRRRR